MTGETRTFTRTIRPAICATVVLALALIDMPAQGQYPYTQPNQNYGRTYPGYSGSPYTGSYGSPYSGNYNPNTRGYSGYQGYSGSGYSSRYSSPYSGGGFGGSTFGGNTFGGSTFGGGSSMFNNRGFGSMFGSGMTGSTRYRDPNTGRYSSSRTGQGTDRYGNTNSRYGNTNSRYGNTNSRYDRSSRYNRTGRGTPTPAIGQPGATPAPGQEGPASTRTGRPAQVVQGQARTGPVVAGGGSQGPQVTAQLQFKPSPDVAVLYMTPMQSQVAVGKEFETKIALSNPAEKQFESIEIVLRFNPLVLEPLRLDDDLARPLLEGDADSFVLTEAGLLVYEAKLANPSNAQALEVCTVRWRTMGVSPHSEISFAGARGYETTFRNEEDKNILGGTGNDGTLGMGVQIYSPEELADGPPLGDALIANRENPSLPGGISLRLVCNEKEIPANEDFYIGVWYENPMLVECSTIRFKIRFDPRVLEVVDDDTNNWIAQGVNVFDGDYHKDFPFDIHVTNSAKNDIGLIEYAMATTVKRSFPDEGYLARIRFRPKALADSTAIKFEFGADNDRTRTQVTFLGTDVLGSPENPQDGVTDVAVSIRRPQLPRLLMEER